jgi:hypothetical protein
MKRLDAILFNLVSIKFPPLLTRWAINYTFWKKTFILIMIEYATLWVEADFVFSKQWEYILFMLTKVQNRFSLLYNLINNNASKFNSSKAEAWHQQYGTSVHPTTPAQPRGNSKVEQINDQLKATITRMHLAYSETLLPDLLQTAVKLHNRITRPNGYSPYFLMYGTIPPNRTSPEAYAKESTWKEKETHEKKAGATS